MATEFPESPYDEIDDSYHNKTWAQNSGAKELESKELLEN